MTTRPMHRWIATGVLSIIAPIAIVAAVAWWSGYRTQIKAADAFLKQVDPVLLGSEMSPLPRYAEIGRRAMMLNQSTEWMRVTGAWRRDRSTMVEGAKHSSQDDGEVLLAVAGLPERGRVIHRQSERVTARFVLDTSILNSIRIGSTLSAMSVVSVFVALCPAVLWSGRAVFRQGRTLEDQVRELRTEVVTAQTDVEAADANAVEARQRHDQAESEVLTKQQQLDELQEEHGLWQELSEEDRQRIESEREDTQHELDEALERVESLEVDLREKDEFHEEALRRATESHDELQEDLSRRSRATRDANAAVDMYLAGLNGQWTDSFRRDLRRLPSDKTLRRKILRALVRIDYGLMPGEPKIIRGMESLRIYERHVGRDFRIYFQRSESRNHYLILSAKVCQETDIRNKLPQRA